MPEHGGEHQGYFKDVNKRQNVHLNYYMRRLAAEQSLGVAPVLRYHQAGLRPQPQIEVLPQQFRASAPAAGPRLPEEQAGCSLAAAQASRIGCLESGQESLCTAIGSLITTVTVQRDELANLRSQIQAMAATAGVSEPFAHAVGDSHEELNAGGNPSQQEQIPDRRRDATQRGIFSNNQ